MKIEFTQHAWVRSKQREISQTEIIKAIQKPDLVSLEDEDTK